jgi:hypothetical protein
LHPSAAIVASHCKPVRHTNDSQGDVITGNTPTSFPIMKSHSSLCSNLRTHRLLFVLLLILPACKKTPEATTSPTTNPTSNGPSQELATSRETSQLQAEKLIGDHPNLSIIETKDGQIHFKNKYSQLTLSLSYQAIIDGKYKVLATTGPEYLKSPILKPAPTPDWGKSPEWIPHFPQAVVQRGAMHSPLRDGSVWGNINVICPDTVENVKKFYTTQFIELGVPLHTVSSRNDTTIVTFQKKNEGEEKRQATCTLRVHGKQTRISIQYSYGMP